MIKVICTGKIKEDYMIKGIEDYVKRISKYTKFQLIEVNQNKLSENIIKNINSKDYVIKLDRLGKEISSIQLAKMIDQKLINYPSIIFIIGDSNGIPSEVPSHLSLSFSELTFTHQMFRIMLLEQIYRAHKINNNETYHK